MKTKKVFNTATGKLMPVKKDLPRGSYRVAEGASVLGEGRSDSDFAHMDVSSPISLKRRELSEHDAANLGINPEREKASSSKRADKETKPL